MSVDLNIIIGAVSAAAAVVAAYYARRATLNTELADILPHMEVESEMWEKPDWLTICIRMTNSSPLSWSLTGAKVLRPKGAKISSVFYLQRRGGDGFGNQGDPDPDNTIGVGSETKAVAKVAASGKRGNPNFIGDNDSFVEIFWLQFPDRFEGDFSIEFTLLSSAFNAEDKKITLSRRLVPRNAIASD